jgi:hypothetical protein
MSQPSSGLYRHYTAIHIETESGTFTTRVEAIDMTLPDVVDELLVPVLLAAGFSRSGIAKIIDSEML